eukprot:CAMPEP_0183414216 /NCGR_PEP_ID=MMETSP0370-20130417/22245_1 /TAXON_ID=268820 /ORGANISM="Peridinium aciculiferum, Strain PAER-2" /LENGTH=78 /DNA_ID=CAMNT_0025597521 /DNA_START=465 /DNA_END=697 /DNA_ORIENTATION=-
MSASRVLGALDVGPRLGAMPLWALGPLEGAGSPEARDDSGGGASAGCCRAREGRGAGVDAGPAPRSKETVCSTRAAAA